MLTAIFLLLCAGFNYKKEKPAQILDLRGFLFLFVPYRTSICDPAGIADAVLNFPSLSLTIHISSWFSYLYNTNLRF